MAVLSATDSSAREKILEKECQGDSALRRNVESLLEAHDRRESFILDSVPTESNQPAEWKILEGPGTVIGPYKLLQQIGEGGMGIVFMAAQSTPIQRTVALKIVKPGMDSRQVVARFEAERQTLALMDHPNIARVLDAGTTDTGRPYFVMELVKGIPITKYCDEHHLSVTQRLELFMIVCQAVQHAHQKGVIHRDIKPSNVLVAEYDHHAVPKVIDFGVAKATGLKLTERTMFTEFGQMLGTIEYMSPEQAKFNQLDIDTRSDIYSLGVLLYELLTGSTPFERKQLRDVAYDEVLRIIREDEPPKPSTRVSTAAELPLIATNRRSEPKKLSVLIKGELDWVVMRALEKDRNRRYETANGFAMDIQRFLAGEAVFAHPPSSTYRLKKFLKKRRGPVAAVAILLLVLIGGILGTSIGMLRANRAESKAIHQRDDALAARKEAFNVLTDLTDNTVGALLAQSPSLSSSQKQFLERVIARYEDLAQNLDSVDDKKSMQAHCFEQVGRTYFLLGDYQRANDVLQQASEMLSQLRIDNPNDPDFVSRSADCLNLRSATSSHMQQFAEQDRFLDEALAIAENGYERFADDQKIARSLAVFYSNRALRHWKDPAARLVDIQRSVDVGRSLMVMDSSSPLNRRTLAVCLSTSVEHYALLDEIDAARAALEEVERLVDGIELDGKRILGYCYESLAGAFDRTNQQEAAIAAYRMGVHYYEERTAESPGDSTSMHALIEGCKLLEQLLRRANRHEEADLYFRRANALAEASVDRSGGEVGSLGTYVDLHSAVARSQWNAGRKQEWLASIEKLVAAGHRLIAARPAPLPSAQEVDVIDCKRQAHRLRLLVDACNDAEKWNDAIAFGEQQRQHVEAIMSQNEPMTDELFVLLHSAHWGLTRSYMLAGRLEEAETQCEELIRITAWTGSGPANDDACLFISKTYQRLGSAGRPADPVIVLKPGLEEWKARLAERPGDSMIRSKLIRGYRTLGLTLEYLHRFEDAVRWGEEAIAMLGSPLPPRSELSPMDGEHVAQLLLGVAVCLDATGDEERSEAAWAASRNYSGERIESFEYYNRAVKLARNGQGEKGVALVERQLAAAGPDPTLRYNAACVYAQASTDTDLAADRSEEFARRAIELLNECRSSNYFENASHMANARRDPDLDPLRRRQDFKEQFPEFPEEIYPNY